MSGKIKITPFCVNFMHSQFLLNDSTFKIHKHLHVDTHSYPIFTCLLYKFFWEEEPGQHIPGGVACLFTLSKERWLWVDWHSFTRLYSVIKIGESVHRMSRAFDFT